MKGNTMKQTILSLPMISAVVPAPSAERSQMR